MKIIKTEHKLCSSCNEVHDVSTVAVLESTKINNKYIRYNAEYEFCEFNNCLVDSTELRKKNRLHRTNDEKKTHRNCSKEGRCIMKELKDICFQSRTKAGLSQEQFAKIIGSTQTEISFTERGFIPASEEKVQRIINFAKQIEDKEG